MTIRKEFEQKNGLAVRVIARDLLTMADGDKLKTISTYESQISCSRWTIQTAIQFLLGNGCFVSEASGPRGTVVHALDKKLLYQYAELDPLLCLLPISSTSIHDSLFTGIVDAVRIAGIPVDFAHMVPASKRLSMLAKHKCHCILTSKLAYEVEKEIYPEIEIGIELNGSAYCGAYKIFTARDDVSGIEDGMKVGIYDAAVEQQYLTKMLCEGKTVEEKYGNYQSCLIMLATGEIDVLVQREEVVDLPKIPLRKIDIPDLGIEDWIKMPVILVNRDEYGIGNLLRGGIDADFVAYVQDSILAGRRMSSYF